MGKQTVIHPHNGMLFSDLKKESYEATKDLEETNALYYVTEASLETPCPVIFQRRDVLGTTETATHQWLPGPQGERKE